MINSRIKRLATLRLTRKLFHIYRKITFSSNVSLPQVRPIKIKKSVQDISRINLLIPSINDEHFYGGTATALKLYNELLEKGDPEFRGRIIVTDAKPSAGALKRFNTYRLIPMSSDSGHNREVTFLSPDNRAGLFVTANDRFISTAWWTAYAALDITAQQISLFGPKEKILVYLIQDFEPGFYNWSSHYALAESTYQSPVPTLAVFNSSFLQNYFKTKSYVFFKEYAFEPRLNPALEKWLPRIGLERKRQILFYGRPTVDRNCFPLIIEALRKWVRHENNDSQWRIISMGEKHPDIHLDGDSIVESVGKLSLPAYAKLLTESAVGISFMVSPHPSYPPLEMAHFGLMTLTNTYAGKDLSTFHQNIISLDRLTPETVAGALGSLTRRFTNDPLAGMAAKSLTPSFTQSTDQFPFIKELLNHWFEEPTDIP